MSLLPSNVDAIISTDVPEPANNFARPVIEKNAATAANKMDVATIRYLSIVLLFMFQFNSIYK